ncbi:MAG TPA: NAD-dependent epimerase/dehydratase family protein [Thermoanaerobaculia bacterium]|nr:NAD-dependent epimerase/dehydratase family protein [Thermoanaerobaculia bacterium]
MGPSKIRAAVVGAGYVAAFHIEAMAGVPGLEIAAVCDPDLERARALAQRWGIPAAVASIEELAALDVHVAHVLTPPDLHVRVTRQLLEAGIGAFVEKPFALSSRDARELAELAAARGIPLGVNHNNLHHPAFTRLLGWVRAGRIGRVEHVRICLSVPLAQLDAGDFSHWMFRSPENIVFEQAPHPLSQLHALIGRVREAHTTLLGTRELHPGQIFHDRWLVAATGERGTAEIYMSFGRPFHRWTLEVLGTDGSAEADLGHGFFSFEEKTSWLDFWNGFLAGRRRARALRRDSRENLLGYARYTLGLGRRADSFFAGMRGSIEEFYAALRAGQAPSVGAEVLEWCEAISEIARRPAHSANTEALPVPAEPSPPRPGEIVVLGGTGFIGRRVVQGLLDRGAPVTAVVRRTHGLPPSLLEAAREGRLRLLKGSLEDRVSLAAAFQGAQTVLHLATGGGDTWEKVERSMVRGSAGAAEEAMAQGVGRFVYVSSIAALYGGPDAGTAVLEDSLDTDPLPEARDVYSRGKAETERALVALHRERGLPLVIARPGVVLGEGTPFQHSGFGLWVRDNHCVGWGLGETPLPLVTADDVAEALVRIALHEGDGLHGKALNLCGRPALSAREVVDQLRIATGRDLHFHPRPLWLSQILEIGKWVVKKAGRRPGTVFPSYRDLKARALVPAFPCKTAREVLGWSPVDDREGLLERTVRIYSSNKP